MKLKKNGLYLDHKGNSFNSIPEMCEHRGIDEETFLSRLFGEGKWNLEESLTFQFPNQRSRLVYLPDGRTLPSIKYACQLFKTSYSKVLERIGNGWDAYSALVYNEKLSFGEFKIKDFLDERNITYFHNKSLKTIFEELSLKNEFNEFVDILLEVYSENGLFFTRTAIGKLRPDFALLSNNKIHSFIEFDGKQHFDFVKYFYKTLENFLKLHSRDEVKNDFSEVCGIPLLRIRYDQVENVDVMINDLLENPNKYLTQHNTFLTEEEYWKPFQKNKDSLVLSF